MGSDYHKLDLEFWKVYFNPRSPHGERLGTPGQAVGTPAISIHAPRMGSDPAMDRDDYGNSKFQSTLPAWGATTFTLHSLLLGFISIHAPRMGSDHL